MAVKDGLTVPIALEDIYYFEAVDNKVFLYKDQEVLSCDKKLYELEQLLLGTSFVRVSKSSILNTFVVESVKAQLRGRLEARLRNGEKMLISKHYLQDFRKNL